MDKTNEVRVNKAAFLASMTVIGAAITFLLVACYLAFVPVNVVTVNKQPYTVTTKTVKAGDNLIYLADVCKHKDINSSVVRTLIDEQGIHYPIASQLSTIPPGCQKNPVVVPTLPTMRPGTWYLTLDVTYQVNVLRSQTYHFKTETFTIEAK